VLTILRLHSIPILCLLIIVFARILNDDGAPSYHTFLLLDFLFTSGALCTLEHPTAQYGPQE
jgi:hypothetical protein